MESTYGFIRKDYADEILSACAVIGGAFASPNSGITQDGVDYVPLDMIHDPRDIFNALRKLNGYFDPEGDGREELEMRYGRLLHIAKKMHLWIFHHTADEQAAYDECGLTDEENAMLGYGGQFEIETEPF